MNTNRLYIITRTDLTCSCPAVQAGHMVAEFCLNMPTSGWNNDTLIYLKVNDIIELMYYYDLLNEKRYSEVGTFREPDMNNEITSIGVVLNIEQSAILEKLELL